MSIALRCILILASILTTYYIIRKIRHSKAKIEDSIYWILISLLLIFLSIFPGALTYVAHLIGFASPVNLLFLIMIFLLIVKVFSLSLALSTLDTKFRSLAQELAIREKQSGEEDKNEQ